MVFVPKGAAWGAAAAVAALAVLMAPEPAHAFGVGAAPGFGTAGNVQNLRPSAATSSFLRAGPARGTGECSPTSLSTSYAVKPEMARSRASEWRKLRTRGPGFEEKVRAYLPRSIVGFVCQRRNTLPVWFNAGWSSDFSVGGFVPLFRPRLGFFVPPLRHVS